VRGDTWTPPALTPPSPDWPSSNAAFAFAAKVVLDAYGGVADGAAASAAQLGVRAGTELPMDVTAGGKIGLAAGRLALAKR
jgi:uncharacterized membrane protein